MWVAFSSDNHLDVNQVSVEETLHQQAKCLNEHHVQAYIHGGDLFNDFRKTKQYMHQLERQLAGHAYYILGNHDMLNHADYATVEHYVDPQYIHHRWIDIPQTDWRIIGNNGWYDYSFSTYADDPERVAKWKKVYWLDSSIDQPMNDLERMQLVNNQISDDLEQAKLEQKRVILVTHFAPRHELLNKKPSFVDTPRKNYFYQMINAMMGSDQLGELVESYPNVQMVMYGHLHRQHPTLTRHGVTYYHKAVGVKNKRLNEWQAPTFIKQWQQTLRIIDLK